MCGIIGCVLTFIYRAIEKDKDVKHISNIERLRNSSHRRGVR